MFVITSCLASLGKALKLSSHFEAMLTLATGLILHWCPAIPIPYFSLAAGYYLWFALGYAVHILEASSARSQKLGVALFLPSALFLLAVFLGYTAPPTVNLFGTGCAIISLYLLMPNADNRALGAISKNSMGMYLFHSPLLYFMFSHFPDINPIAMVAINFLGMGCLAFALTSLLRKCKLGWAIGE